MSLQVVIKNQLASNQPLVLQGGRYLPVSCTPGDNNGDTPVIVAIDRLQVLVKDVVNPQSRRQHYDDDDYHNPVLATQFFSRKMFKFHYRTLAPSSLVKASSTFCIAWLTCSSFSVPLLSWNVSV